MWLKGNLHTHSTVSDGSLKPGAVIKKYRDKGYDFVAMTDHGPDPEPYSYPDIDGITVLEGVEVSRNHHWNYIEGDEETLTIWNHPFRYDESHRDIDRCGKDLVEAVEHGDLFYNVNHDSSEVIEKAKTPAIFTDDAHSEKMMGHAWVLVNTESSEKDAIITALKKGRYTVGKKEM